MINKGFSAGLHLLLVALLTCLAAQEQSAQSRPAKGQAAQSKTPVNKPFTLDRLVIRLKDVAAREYTETALIRRVEKDGIDFTATPANLARLTKAGGSALLIDAVKRLGPVPPEPPVPVVVEPALSRIEVTCSPAECSVGIAGHPRKSSVGGKLLLDRMKQGVLEIEVDKEGYLPFRSVVRLGAEPEVVSAVLMPDLAMRKSWGVQLNGQMISALGGDAQIRAPRTLLERGDATIWGKDGRKYSCALETLLRSPDKAFFRTKSGKKSFYEVDFLPNFRSRSNLSEDEARDLDAGLRLFLRYQPYALVSRLEIDNSQTWSQNKTAGDGAEIHAGSSTEKFLIILDSNSRPKEIREDVPFGEGVRVLFSGYQLRGDVYVPDQVSIVWAGTPKQGIAIHFDRIELNPSLKSDAGYRVKKGSRLK